MPIVTGGTYRLLSAVVVVGLERENSWQNTTGSLLRWWRRRRYFRTRQMNQTETPDRVEGAMYLVPPYTTLRLEPAFFQACPRGVQACPRGVQRNQAHGMMLPFDTEKRERCPHTAVSVAESWKLYRIPAMETQILVYRGSLVEDRPCSTWDPRASLDTFSQKNSAHVVGFCPYETFSPATNEAFNTC